MIYDVTAQFAELMDNAIRKHLANLPLSYPCKVLKVHDVFVEVVTLLKKDSADVSRVIPILQSPYLTLPIKEGDIGIALNCSFLFEALMQDNEITENIPATKQNGLFFVPLTSQSKFKGELGKTTLANQDHSCKINLDNSTIEIKGSSATLGEILTDLIDMLISLNADPIAGNGSPLASPTLATELPKIKAKITGNLK